MRAESEMTMETPSLFRSGQIWRELGANASVTSAAETRENAMFGLSVKRGGGAGSADCVANDCNGTR